MVFWFEYYGGGVFRNNTIGDNGYSGAYISNYAAPTLENNRFESNGDWGLYFRYATAIPPLKENVFTGNKRSAHIAFSAMPNPEDGNVFGPSRINGLWLNGNSRSEALRLAVQSVGDSEELNTYQINGTATMNSGHRLTVDPGVIVKFADNARLNAFGGLTAKGTAERPIAFTSYRDDRWGGDFNNDGGSAVSFQW